MYERTAFNETEVTNLKRNMGWNMGRVRVGKTAGLLKKNDFTRWCVHPGITLENTPGLLLKKSPTIIIGES